MEFLDINLTKGFAIHSHICWRILGKTILFSGLKNPLKKKSVKQENSSQFMNRILQKWKIRVKNQTKLESEKTQVYAQQPLLQMAFKNSISGNVWCKWQGCKADCSCTYTIYICFQHQSRIFRPWGGKKCSCVFPSLGEWRKCVPADRQTCGWHNQD